MSAEEHELWLFEEEERMADELGMGRQQDVAGARKLLSTGLEDENHDPAGNLCRFSSLTTSPQNDKPLSTVKMTRKRSVLSGDVDADNAFTRLKRRLVDGPDSSGSGKSSFVLPVIEKDEDEVGDMFDTQDIAFEDLYSPAGDLLVDTVSAVPSNVNEPKIVKNKFMERPNNSAFFKSAKSFSGGELYFSYDKFRKIQYEQQAVRKKGTIEDSLLKRSVYRLMEDIKAEAVSDKAQGIRDNYALSVAHDAAGDDDEDESQLLVDKYRPRSYIDLLTDEWLNQEVMMWVKQWDECVFKKTPSEALATKFRHKTDKLGRPEKKILLLAGPPGFSKTTMAHVIAKQNGYNPFEINASDERAAELVNNRLMNAINSQSVFGDKKPNLVIIDEIDGALNSSSDAGFIKLLVELATSSDLPNISKQKKGKTLLRPIICICNDLYAPALRPLRAVAQIYTFRKTAAAVMSKRLKSICDMEGFKVDKSALNYLVEKSDCDIRTCLNTLQVLKGKLKLQQKINSVTENRKAPIISLQMMKDISIGDKDIQKTIFNIWNSIFIESNDFSKTYGLIESYGDHDMVMNGCFESYLNMEFRDMDNTGINIVKVHDYVNFFDNLMRKCFDGYDIPFNYFGSSIMSFSVYCRHIGSVNFQTKLVQFPRSDFDNRQKLKLNRQVALDVLNHVSPIMKSWLGNAEQFSSQMVSLVFRIISPNIRPINPQLMKDGEKEALDHLVKSMAALRITFLHDRTTQTGQAIMKLDPPIENLINFEGHAMDKLIMRHSHSIRQHLAQMIDRELICSSASIRSDKNQSDMFIKKQVSKKDDKKAKKPEAKRRFKAVLQQDVVPKDFFGRPIPAAELAAAAALKASELSTYMVQFKYHDGFSNAVKRTVTIGDFLKLK